MLAWDRESIEYYLLMGPGHVLVQMNLTNDGVSVKFRCQCFQ